MCNSGLLAARLGISTVVSTDSVRHMLRSFTPATANPLLWASTYEVSFLTHPTCLGCIDMACFSLLFREGGKHNQTPVSRPKDANPLSGAPARLRKGGQQTAISIVRVPLTSKCLAGWGLCGGASGAQGRLAGLSSGAGLRRAAPPDSSWKGKGSMPPLQRADSVKQRTIQVGAFTGHIRGNPKQGSCPKHMASQAPFQGAFLPSLHCSRHGHLHDFFPKRFLAQLLGACSINCGCTLQPSPETSAGQQHYHGLQVAQCAARCCWHMCSTCSQPLPATDLGRGIAQGYKAQSEMVLESLDRLIGACEGRRESMVVEGVHLSLNAVVRLMSATPPSSPSSSTSPTRPSTASALRCAQPHIIGLAVRCPPS